MTAVIASVDSAGERIGAGFFLLMIGGLMMGSLAFLISRFGFSVRRLLERPTGQRLAHRTKRRRSCWCRRVGGRAETVVDAGQPRRSRNVTRSGRAPKVEGRTPASPMYHFASLALLVGTSVTATLDFIAGHHADAAFAGINAALLAFAVTASVGWGALVDDVRLGLADRWGRSAR